MRLGIGEIDYTSEFRKFITGQYLSIGLRVTASVIIPAIILYNLGLLSHMMAIPMGALCVGLTDNPGPPRHRLIGVGASIILNFVVALLTIYSQPYQWILTLDIIVFGMFFTMLGVYGSRAQSVGSIALLVFIFNISNQSSKLPALDTALLFSVGGMWYALVGSVMYTLRPYRIVQQKIGECVIDTAKYLQVKANFYESDANYDELTNQLMQHQIKIQQDHADLREMLFKTRRIMNEPTTKSRMLMLMFLDSIDLFEWIMTSQQHYADLHKEFDRSGILKTYQHYILLLSQQLHEIGIAIQAGVPSKMLFDLKEEFKTTKEAYRQLKQSAQETGATEHGMNDLFHILNSMQNVTERITRLHDCTTFDKKIGKEIKLDTNLDLEAFITHQSYNPRLLWDNFSLNSLTFRHAVRLTAALLIGYLISQLYPFGHDYWILLTISTIIRPAYSLTWQRNGQRLAGTFLGGILGFLCFHFLNGNDTILFVVMLSSMILAYTFLKTQYLVFTITLTLYLMLSFYFLNPVNFTVMLSDRIIDTGIGSVVAFIISLTVLPTWEHQQMKKFIRSALESNKTYFDTVASAYVGQSVDVTQFKLARKNAFVALANVSDNLQRMLSEPKDKRTKLLHYHQFVASTHVLTSNIASLSYYNNLGIESYVSPGFQVLIADIDRRFDRVLKILENGSESISPESLEKTYIYHLFEEQRKMSLEKISRLQKKELENMYSDLHAIIHQFELINMMAADEERILKKMY